MNENELNELVIVEQLPVIKQQLQIISDEVDKEINYALSLEVNEDSVKEVKNARTRLNKIKSTMEDKRKQVKNAVMNPYNEFEEIYNELVKNKLSNADTTLKEKIDSVENTLKQEKQEELELFAKEYIEFNNLENIISFDDIPLNITLSASMKSLKEEIKRFIEDVANDIELIKLEEYSDEILDLYINNEFTNFDLTKSKLEVINRHKRLEKIQEQHKEVQLQIDEDAKIVEKVDEIVAPVEAIEDEDVITVSFKVTGTKEKIKQIKELIIKLGVEYE